MLKAREAQLKEAQKTTDIDYRKRCEGSAAYYRNRVRDAEEDMRYKMKELQDIANELSKTADFVDYDIVTGQKLGGTGDADSNEWTKVMTNSFSAVFEKQWESLMGNTLLKMIA